MLTVSGEEKGAAFAGAADDRLDEAWEEEPETRPAFGTNKYLGLIVDHEREEE